MPAEDAFSNDVVDLAKNFQRGGTLYGAGKFTRARSNFEEALHLLLKQRNCVKTAPLVDNDDAIYVNDQIEIPTLAELRLALADCLCRDADLVRNSFHT